MFVNIKIGLFSMVLILLFTTICLIQLGNDERTNWKPGQNIMTYFFIVWLLFYILEILNPNNVMAAWNINLTPYALTPLICAFVVPIVIRTKKDIELLLIIWSIFVLIFTLKGYWQKNHGFSSKDLYFLHVVGGARTHIIWSGIRYFSCFSDAANYGVHAAMSTVTFAIASFFVDSRWKRIYFLFIAFCGIYGMGISGTRSAMGVLMGGMLMITVIAKNWKALLGGIFISISIFAFFYYTNIGSGNQYIHKMRSSFHPTEDASYLVRVENRMRMKELMAKKPIGYGVGLSTGNFEPKEQMPYPPDSWLVGVWVETGIVGLILYLGIHGILFAWCSWLLMFKVRNKSLRGLVAAWLCMDAGYFIAAYVNDVMQYPNPLTVYIGFALCFAAPHIDKRISEEEKEKELVESLQNKIHSVSYEIIVVDNASHENEAAKIHQLYPTVVAIRSNENSGFSGGNNIGIQVAKGKYIFLINNDTYIESDHIAYLVERLESRPEIGGVSPKIRFAFPPQHIQFAGFTPLSQITLRNHMLGFDCPDDGTFDTPHTTPYLHGAAMMFKREVIEKIGMMPEIFFLYYEELDWSTSMTRAGYELWYDPCCTIFHKESQSTGQLSKLRTYYLTRNRLFYARRNLKGFNRIASIIYQSTVAATKNSLAFILKGRFDLAAAIFYGVNSGLLRPSSDKKSVVSPDK